MPKDHKQISIQFLVCLILVPLFVPDESRSDRAKCCIVTCPDRPSFFNLEDSVTSCAQNGFNTFFFPSYKKIRSVQELIARDVRVARCPIFLSEKCCPFLIAYGTPFP